MQTQQWISEFFDDIDLTGQPWAPLRVENEARTAEVLYLLNTNTGEAMGAITNRRFNYHSMGQYYQLDENDMPIDISQSIDHEPCNDGEYWMTNCSCFEPPLTIEGTLEPHPWTLWGDYQTIGIDDIPPIPIMPHQSVNVRWYSPFTGEPDVPMLEATYPTDGSPFINVAGLDLSDISPIRLFKLTAASGRMSAREQDTDATKEPKAPIVEKETEPIISIWPNPASDHLCVSTGLYDGPTRIEIYDSRGQFIIGDRFSGRAKKLDTSDLGNGVYLLHFTTDNNTDVWKRFQKI